MDRVAFRSHHLLGESRRQAVYFLAQRPAADGKAVEVQHILQLPEDRGQAAGPVQIVHVIITRGFEIDEHRRFTAHLVEGLVVDLIAKPAGQRGQMDNAVGGSACCQQNTQRIGERSGCQDFVGRELFPGHCHRTAAGSFGVAQAISEYRRNGGAAGQHHPHRFGHAGDRARRAHDPAGSTAGHEVVGDFLDFFIIHRAGPIIGPESPAIGTGAETLSAMTAREHGAGNHADGRQVHACGGHQLGWNGFIAAANEDCSIHRLGPQHLLGIHGHQVAQEHRGRVGERFMQRDGRKFDRQPSCHQHAPGDSLDDFRNIGMTGIVTAVCIGDADHRPVQCRLAVAHRFDEGFAQIKRKFRISIARQGAPHADLIKTHIRLCSICSWLCRYLLQLRTLTTG